MGKKGNWDDEIFGKIEILKKKKARFGKLRKGETWEMEIVKENLVIREFGMKVLWEKAGNKLVKSKI